MYKRESPQSDPGYLGKTETNKTLQLTKFILNSEIGKNFLLKEET